MLRSKRFLLLIALFNALAQAQHLILHFDVNKTLIAEDIASKKTVEDVIIECLSEKTDGIWDDTIKKEISFSTYVKEHVFPGKTTKELKKLRREQMHAFLAFLQKNNDPRYPSIHTQFKELTQKVKLQKGKIFNAFYKFLSYLDKKNINYTIILRTFGEDLDLISSELATYTSLTFAWEGYFKKNILYITNTITQEQFILKTPQEICAFFKNHKHIKIKDDFDYWHTHGEQSTHGKLFPINKKDLTTKSYFFDDNADNHIIHLCDVENNTFLPIEAEVKAGTICVVDTLQAIEDDLYFIKHIQKYR